jgi:GH24 family phage-related lysozyme (muramidase)
VASGTPPGTQPTAVAIPDKTLQLVCGYEELGGFRPSTNRYYPYHGEADAAGVYTVGWGHVISHDTPEAIRRYQVDGLTRQQCDDLLAADLQPRARILQRLLVDIHGKPNYTLWQFAGALSCFYNIEAAWTTGTPGIKHRAGDYKAAAESILSYLYDGQKKKSRGLWRRRMSEALCYLTGEVIIAKDAKSERDLITALRKLILVIKPVEFL